MEYRIKDGWKLNPNSKIVQGITKMIENNEGLCPCIHQGYVKDLHCPCTDYIEEDKCCCSLYIKAE